MRIGKHELALPILQGGMGVGVSMGGLAGAVAACGGMGTISTADAGYLEAILQRIPLRPISGLSGRRSAKPRRLPKALEW